MNRKRVPLVRILFAFWMTGALLAATSVADVPAPSPQGPAQVIQYTAPDGQSYFALLLKRQTAQPAPAPQHHVLLVDTSASQIGSYRDQSLKALRAYVNSLSDGDRVSLYAIDVAATPLTQSFVPARGAELAHALAKLEERPPLGATDLLKAIQTALERIGSVPNACIVYFGDGMSGARLIGTEAMKNVLTQLQSRQVAFHSFAVGPQTDLPTLGLLAQFSGGVVATARTEPSDQTSDPTAVGRRLAAAARQTVFYPDDLRIAQSDVRLLPARALPVRADRETIYLGRGRVGSGTFVDLISRSGKSAALRWTVERTSFVPGGPYLSALWQQADRQGGFVVPLAGRRMLLVAQAEFDRGVADLADAAKEALQQQRVAEAERLGQTVQSLDPRNVDARAVLAASRRVKAEFVRMQQAADDAQPAPSPKPPATKPSAEKPAEPATAAPQELITEVESRQKIITEKMQLETTRAIEEARELAVDDPDAAVSLLKRTRGLVQAAMDMDPEVRQRLEKRLKNAILEIRTQEERREQQRIRQQERFAIVESEKRLQEQMRLDDERIQMLIDRTRALMAEGRRGNRNAYAEAKEVAKAVRTLRPGSGMSEAAVVTTEAAYQVSNVFHWRNLRAERFLQTLEQVEISHVPFPDEPPVRFPPAAVWKSLSERRKKWASVDLHKSTPTEERIVAALDQQTEMEFVETRLADVITYFSELHNIPIIIDNEALAEEGITTDTPINLVLSGIMLRSALKIILEPLGLNYVIEDEVMKITTQTKAEETLQTRVYPVGDLVIPITAGAAGFGGFGSMLGGGFGGGLGGFGGGLGGGLGGFGGGLGGFVAVWVASVAVWGSSVCRPNQHRKCPTRRQPRSRSTRQRMKKKPHCSGKRGLADAPE
ncbi:MAG: hypothetical protein GXP27_17880 [Planctomycetes bacterium]|nr:hypothetical protein [Planctomycetota bacterium]